MAQRFAKGGTMICNGWHDDLQWVASLEIMGRVNISVGQVMYKCSVESSITKNGSMRHKQWLYAS
ncbi:MAG: hypothetical protein KBS65_01920 [Prevotella sp.]|nr:hypothetical protein [Candidatus Equicola stercoris]